MAENQTTTLKKWLYQCNMNFNTRYNSVEYENEILVHVSSKNIPDQSQQ